MNRQLLVTLAVLGSQLLGAFSLRANEAHLLQCGHCAMMARLHARQLAAAEQGKAPQNSYAPDRFVDVTHLKIDVTPNFKERSLNATAILDFAPIAKPLKQWHLNATSLNIRQVTASHAIQATQSTDTHLPGSHPCRGRRPRHHHLQRHPAKGSLLPHRRDGIPGQRYPALDSG